VRLAPADSGHRPLRRRARGPFVARQAPRLHFFVGAQESHHAITQLVFLSLPRDQRLALRELSPQLAALRGSDVPVPAAAPGVTIESFCDSVISLSTKTRPKQLRLLGSDGREYVYLLKVPDCCFLERNLW
jgi:hypothetical protein